MIKKRFKIGEYAMGGIIEVDIVQNGMNLIKDLPRHHITIRALDWNTLETIQTKQFINNNSDIESEPKEYLEELTSYYYAEQVLNWIKSCIKLVGEFD